MESDWEDLDDDDSDPEAESDDDCEEDESMDEPKMLRSKQPRMEKVGTGEHGSAVWLCPSYRIQCFLHKPLSF